MKNPQPNSQGGAQLAELGHLEKLRRTEFDTVSNYFSRTKRVLEIGGGTGYQARLIADRGCDVVSVDVATAGLHAQFFPVQIYDGIHLPMGDETVDVVFSSNVLEHVQDLALMLHDTNRVLRPNGVAIHILPSATWRLWTSVLYPIFVAMSLATQPPAVPGITGRVTPTAIGSTIRRKGIVAAGLRAILWPLLPHGEFSNSLTELFFYRRSYWCRQFKRYRFRVERAFGSQLFYTGHPLFPGITLERRRQLSHLLGSSTNVFVLRKYQAEE